LQSHPAPVTSRERFAWCLYDFANSSFTTVITTVAFSVYFVHVVAGDEPGRGEALWGRGYALSMIGAALLSPVLGAIADHYALKKQFLLVVTAVCVVATAALYFVGPGDALLGLTLFGIANLGFELGYTFYNAFLVELAGTEEMGRLSGYGWAIGYLGGLVSLALVYPFVSGGLAPQNLDSYRMSFPITALFFFAASIPTFLYLHERAHPHPSQAGVGPWVMGVTRVTQTFREIRRYRDLFVYLIAFLIYTDAINTVVIFSGIFAVGVLKFTPNDLIIFFLVMQVSAGLGAYTFGIFSDRLGAKRIIAITLACWIGVVVWAFAVQTVHEFYVIGLVAGALLGANQAVSRTLLGQFTPAGRQAEFFGFFSVSAKFAAVLGPLVYGEIVLWTGNQRWAVLSLSVFFVAGWIVLHFVNERAGFSAAKAQLDPLT
jgi:MFS transporter, UMF1 family